jgi:hypothetical protein
MVWVNLDVEASTMLRVLKIIATYIVIIQFLTTFVISIMKSIDIRAEAAVRLLAEFLDMDDGGRRNAEHFAHG